MAEGISKKKYLMRGRHAVNCRNFRNDICAALKIFPVYDFAHIVSIVRGIIHVNAVCLKAVFTTYICIISMSGDKVNVRWLQRRKFSD